MIFDKMDWTDIVLLLLVGFACGMIVAALVVLR